MALTPLQTAILDPLSRHPLLRQMMAEDLRALVDQATEPCQPQ